MPIQAHLSSFSFSFVWFTDFLQLKYIVQNISYQLKDLLPSKSWLRFGSFTLIRVVQGLFDQTLEVKTLWTEQHIPEPQHL